MTLSVLVSDDDQATRALLGVLVDLDDELTGFPATPGGRFGADRAQEDQPDIVVCDVASSSGQATARRLRDLCPDAVICVLTAGPDVGAETSLLADVTTDKTTVDVSAMFGELKRLCLERRRSPVQPTPAPAQRAPSRAPTSRAFLTTEKEETTP